MSIQWSLVLFSLIAGTGGAALAYAGIGEFVKLANKDRFKLVLIGIILLVVGGICSVFHLKSPENFMSAITHLGSFSGISIELMLIGTVTVCGVVFLIGVMRENVTLSKVFGVICIVLGLLLAYMLGSSYMIAARAGWNTILVPLCYLASSFALGGFVCFAVSTQKETQKVFGIVALAASVLAAAFAVAYGMTASALAASEGTFYFVVSAVGGALAAIAAYFIAFKGKSGAWIWIGLIGALACGLFIRMFMWVVGANMFDAFDIAIWQRALFLP